MWLFKISWTLFSKSCTFTEDCFRNYGRHFVNHGPFCMKFKNHGPPFWQKYVPFKSIQNFSSGCSGKVKNSQGAAQRGTLKKLWFRLIFHVEIYQNGQKLTKYKKREHSWFSTILGPRGGRLEAEKINHFSGHLDVF